MCEKKFVSTLIVNSDFLAAQCCTVQKIFLPCSPVLVDLMKMFKQLAKVSDVPEAQMRSVNHFARCLILGLCHKCLRVLQIPHFLAAYLNPGFGRIPDLNAYIPNDSRWFIDGMNEVDLRTTDRCIKNDSNLYRPSWVSQGSSIREELEKYIMNWVPDIAQPVHDELGGSDSSDDDLAPDFNGFNNLPAAERGIQGSPIDDVSLRFYFFHLFSFAHSTLCCKLRNDTQANKRQNRKLKADYDHDPRCFWNEKDVRAEFPAWFVTLSIFIFSIQSSSANCERSFSRMGWMVGSRRSGITADNTDKRLTLTNQLPQKRRLLELCSERKIKKTKLSEVLFRA